MVVARFLFTINLYITGFSEHVAFFTYESVFMMVVTTTCYVKSIRYVFLYHPQPVLSEYLLCLTVLYY